MPPAVATSFLVIAANQLMRSATVLLLRVPARRVAREVVAATGVGADEVVVGLGDLDAGRLRERDEEVQEVHRVEIEHLLQVVVGLDGRQVGFGRDAGERGADGGVGIEWHHSSSGWWRRRATSERKVAPRWPSVAR